MFRLFALLPFLCFPLWLSAQSSADFARELLLQLGNTEYEGNRVHLLLSPQEKYDTLFSSIRAAKHFVHIEYFWLADDSVGHALVELLAEKARQGVEVRLLIDGYANHKSKNSWKSARIDSLNAMGIRAALFDPLRFPWINHVYHRDHRKIVIVDGQQVFTGGMNIADYYLTGTQRSGTWRDMHLCIEGPAVDEFERVFSRIWAKQTGEYLDSLKYHSESTSKGDITLTIVNREPLQLSERMRHAYTACIDAAQHEVRIINPYPTNVRMVRKAMRRALKRGVEVKIMVSASNDVRVTPCLIGVEMRKLVKHGCEVYYYEGGFHHSKVMMVDGDFCTIGTANLDGRSMLYDYEINAFLFDEEVTRQLNGVFDNDLQNSQQLTLEGFKKRFSLKQRIAGRLFYPIKGLF